jgi:4-hydroxy-tetrahydrodipicolinate synthase
VADKGRQPYLAAHARATISEIVARLVVGRRFRRRRRATSRRRSLPTRRTTDPEHRMHLEGVYTPVVTPLDAAGEPDPATYARVIEHCLAGGVRGLVPCGTTGEYYALSFDERAALLEVARDAAGGRAQLIAGANAGSTREAIRHGEVARDLGYDAVMLAVPPTSLPSQRELAAHFTAVADATGLPIVLYNYPARAGTEIGFACLDAIADRPDIVAIKESSGDFSRFLQLRRRYAGRIEIMCGSDDQAVDYFGWGVRSWLAGTSNVLPQQHVAVLDAANRGDLDQARSLFDALLPWIQDMEGGSYNQKAKLGLAHVGIPCGGVRQPLLPLADADATEHLRVLGEALAAPVAPPLPA